MQKPLNAASVKNEMILTECSLHVLCVHQIIFLTICLIMATAHSEIPVCWQKQLRV